MLVDSFIHRPMICNIVFFVKVPKLFTLFKMSADYKHCMAVKRLSTVASPGITGRGGANILGARRWRDRSQGVSHNYVEQRIVHTHGFSHSGVVWCLKVNPSNRSTTAPSMRTHRSS